MVEILETTAVLLGRVFVPEITSTGARETCALAIPVMALVTPGPAVTARPRLSGQLGVSLGHVHRGPFVAHVDDADAMGVEAHPDRHDVAAAESEDALDPTFLQKRGQRTQLRCAGEEKRHHG